MRSVPGLSARNGLGGGDSLRSEPGAASASPRRVNTILAFVIVMIVALAATFVTFDLMANDDSPEGDNEPEDGNISPLDEWQIYSYGAFTSSVNETVAMVSGEYDPEDTIPDTGGWNAFWLVSEPVDSGDFSYSLQIEIDQAIGVEWSATIGLLVPGYSFPPHGTCNWGMYYYDGHELVAVQHESWKYHRRHMSDNGGYPIFSHGPFLFDLERDPTESYSLIESQPEVAGRLAQMLDDFDAEIEANTRGWLP